MSAFNALVVLPANDKLPVAPANLVQQEPYAMQVHSDNVVLLASPLLSSCWKKKDVSRSVLQ